MLSSLQSRTFQATYTQTTSVDCVIWIEATDTAISIEYIPYYTDLSIVKNNEEEYEYGELEDYGY